MRGGARAGGAERSGAGLGGGRHTHGPPEAPPGAAGFPWYRLGPAAAWGSGRARWRGRDPLPGFSGAGRPWPAPVRVTGAAGLRARARRCLRLRRRRGAPRGAARARPGRRFGPPGAVAVRGRGAPGPGGGSGPCRGGRARPGLHRGPLPARPGRGPGSRRCSLPRPQGSPAACAWGEARKPADPPPRPGGLSGLQRGAGAAVRCAARGGVAGAPGGGGQERPDPGQVWFPAVADVHELPGLFSALCAVVVP